MAFFSRGLNKIQKPYTITHMYKDYIKDKDETSPYHVPYIVYANICSEYYKHIKEIIITGKIVKLRLAIGELMVFKKLKGAYRLCPNWEATLKYGKKMFHLNEHSKRFSYRFSWDMANTRTLFNYTYVFVPCRAAKRELAKLIKEQKYDYFEKYRKQ